MLINCVAPQEALDPCLIVLRTLTTFREMLSNSCAAQLRDSGRVVLT